MKQPSRVLVAIAVVTMVAALSMPAAARAEEPSPANVGFVLYSKTANPGTLIARWTYDNRYFGPGLATGGPVDGFAGNYHVRYFYENGQFSDEYDLQVSNHGSFYDVTWRVGGVVKARGVGMLVDNGTALAVGWHRVD
jgi:hypothetical protein